MIDFLCNSTIQGPYKGTKGQSSAVKHKQLMVFSLVSVTVRSLGNWPALVSAAVFALGKSLQNELDSCLGSMHADALSFPAQLISFSMGTCSKSYSVHVLRHLWASSGVWEAYLQHICSVQSKITWAHILTPFLDFSSCDHAPNFLFQFLNPIDYFDKWFLPAASKDFYNPCLPLARTFC